MYRQTPRSSPLRRVGRTACRSDMNLAVDACLYSFHCAFPRPFRQDPLAAMSVTLVLHARGSSGKSTCWIYRDRRVLSVLGPLGCFSSPYRN